MRAQLAKMERNTGDSGSGDLELPTRKLPQAEWNIFAAPVI